MEVHEINWEVKKALLKNEGKDANYVIFPYGEIGHVVKDALNSMGVQEILVLDNFSTDPEVKPFSYLEEHPLGENDYLLLSTFWQNVKNDVYEVVDENKIFDITFDYYGRIVREVCREKQKTTGSVIQVKNSLFSLPLYMTDHIQRNIFSEERYYEEILLQYYTKVFLGGLLEKP
jgi:hypothetical protein